MITRSFSDKNFSRVVEDFGFLIERIHKERGEFDLRLRNNYFNLYYKGNSMAKVSVMRKKYGIEINKRFIDNAGAQKRSGSSNYSLFVKDPSELRSFFSKNIGKIGARIKKVNWGEEVAFEQMLITDNSPCQNFIIIDRQITGGALGRKRMDLLALRRNSKSDKKWKFLILEVKLGNNRELEGKVLCQLREYMEIIDKDIKCFKSCYERTYEQMKVFGLLGDDSPERIEIEGEPEGMIVVGGYSGLADDAIDKLRVYSETNPSELDKKIFIWRSGNVLTQGELSPLDSEY
jgi:hypothetical protein